MRADEKYIYHIDCFTCCLCNVVLKPGDDYGLHDSLLFCRLHLEQIQRFHYVHQLKIHRQQMLILKNHDKIHNENNERN
jgi:hypothetical protein